MTADWKELDAAATAMADAAAALRTEATRMRNSTNPWPHEQADALLRASRSTARHAAQKAIAALIGSVASAAGDSPLRGLPRLSRTSINAYHGVRLRTKNHDEPLGRPVRGEDWGREALVITPLGELVFARQNEIGDINERPAGPDDLVAEDLRHVIDGVLFISRATHGYVQDRAGALDEIHALARSLLRMLERGE